MGLPGHSCAQTNLTSSGTLGYIFPSVQEPAEPRARERDVYAHKEAQSKPTPKTSPAPSAPSLVSSAWQPPELKDCSYYSVPLSMVATWRREIS